MFNVSSTALNFEDLESFVDTLEPATAEEWTQRFSSGLPENPPSDATCTPQPSFGPTLNP